MAFKKILRATAGLLGALMGPSLPGWALGNNVASYTYTGDQQGLTQNTVYTLSTYGQYLGACAITPNSTTNSGYSANCYSNYGAQNTGLYSAIAFMGTANNPKNAFVVGDNNGNVSIATQNWIQSNGHWVSPSLSQSPWVKACPEGGAVSNLAVDPNGSYLYIGCSIKSQAVVNGANGYYLNRYNLYSSQIKPDGTLGPFNLVTGLFSSFQGEPSTAALWSGVSPVMRAYGPNSPNLQKSAYSGSGAVMVSGLVGGLAKAQSYKGVASKVPVSSGVICSNGQCNPAYNFTLEAKDSFSIFTAAEAGVDYYNPNYGQALYWNQVAGHWNAYQDAAEDGSNFYPSIEWSKTSNTIYSCNVSSNPIGSPATSCGGGSYALRWSAQGMPAAGNGNQIDISNLLFIPTPKGITTPYTQGLLIIGTWTNGYLAYHSPALQNNSTALFLSGNGSSGQVGNVNSLMNDSNGNLLFATNSSGVFVFNPFGGQNTANGTDITLIPNESDSGSHGGCSLCKIADITEIIYYSVKTIAEFAVATPEAELSPKSPTRPGVPMQESQHNQFMAPMMLSRVLGTQPYRGQFRYTEQQLGVLGVKRGMQLRGLSFRDAPGISTAPLQAREDFNQFTITVSGQKNTSTAHYKPLDTPPSSFSPNKVWPEKTTEAIFHKPILFPQALRYSGGDLIIRISHGGRRSSQPIMIDAFQTPGPQGSYSRSSTLNQEIKVVPMVRFVH